MITTKQVFAVEGLDRLGKSTLIDGIKNRLGFHQVIHFSKPEVLDFYNRFGKTKSEKQEVYQRDCFLQSFTLADSGAKLIFDRWHLGEAVYAPLYRGYDGNYVFNLEHGFDLNKVRLILLTEDFAVSKHFISDGESFDDSKREAEQQMFIQAFNKSAILDKCIICVTDPETGEYRSKEDILNEALEF